MLGPELPVTEGLRERVGKRMKNDGEQRMDVMETEEEEGHSHFFLAQDVFELEEKYLGTFPREP